MESTTNRFTGPEFEETENARPRYLRRIAVFLLALTPLSVSASGQDEHHHEQVGQTHHSQLHVNHTNHILHLADISHHMSGMMYHHGKMESHDGAHAAKSAPLYRISIQTGTDDKVFTEKTRTTYFTQALQYHRGRWSLDAVLPIAVRHSDSATFKGRGFGDLHIRNSIALLGAHGKFSVSAVGLIKAPLGNAKKGFGSGEWDAGAFLETMSFAGPYFGFAEFGYMALGEPLGVAFQNPMTYMAGGGRFFAGRRLGLIAQLAGSGEVAAGAGATRLAGLGVLWNIPDQASLFMTTTIGLTDTAQDISFSFGVSGPF